MSCRKWTDHDPLAGERGSSDPLGKLGATFSIIHSAAGRAFPAAMPEDTACSAFAGETAQADTPSEAGQPLDLKGFLEMLRRCRKTRFSHVRGDYTTGIEAVGAVAYNAAGEVAFILTVVGRSGILAADGKPEAPEALKRSVSRLSAMPVSGALSAFPCELARCLFRGRREKVAPEVGGCNAAPADDHRGYRECSNPVPFAPCRVLTADPTTAAR